MPKLPSKLKAEANSKHVCVACSGTGKSSAGGRCFPCNGTGIPPIWVCPRCGAKHYLFKKQVCRNEKCKDFGKEQ